MQFDRRALRITENHHRDLAAGPRRFVELQRVLPGISTEQLRSRLNRMVADGLLTRKRYREVPPRVDYALTDRARDLMPVLGELGRWGYEWVWSAPRGSGPCLEHTAVCIAQVVGPQAIASARALIEAYAASLNIDLSFQDFAHELANLDFAYRDIGRLLDEWQERMQKA